ncbi:MAG: winged helix-turn-helix domain-containing protein [Clostridia bacterium]|nr:winged helix-turn-helix domain-containing protein [Clostridia bacterium]MDY3785076.1 winged helix-turn-helix domain-containing protein [Eubacteriales bacterium]
MKKGQKNTAANNTEAMGKKTDIAIFSKDALLARTVELLGKLLGYASRTYASYSGQLCKITVIDLDSFPDEKVTEIIEAGRGKHYIIGISECPKQDNQVFNVFLHRPFQMQDLRAALVGYRAADEYAISDIPEHGGMGDTSEPISSGLSVYEKSASWNGKEIRLTPNEALVLDCLMKNRGNPVSREDLKELTGSVGSNAVDVYICTLKRKLRAVSDIEVIRAVRNFGYIIKK